MKLITGLTQSLQLYLFNSSKEFKKRNLPIDMAEVLATATNVLICLPEELADAKTASKMVDKISSAFPRWAITILTSDANATSFLQKSQHTVVSYSEEDVAKSGKPKKAFLQKSLQRSFDIAIDMSIPFSFTNLVFMWLSSATLRVGYHHENRETLYNFVIRHKADATFEYSYLSLINYLQSFH